MNNAKSNENDLLLMELAEVRDKCKRSKRKTLHKKHNRLRDLCMTKFDFLVDRRTRRYQAFANYEDLKQDGRIALMNALNSYQPDKGNFYSWADYYIKTKIYREANRHSIIKIPMDKAKDMAPHKVSQLPIIVDQGLDALSFVEEEQVRSFVKKAIEKLPSQQAQIIKMRYEFNNCRTGSIKKICQKLKISRDNCIELLSAAEERLKEELQHFDFIEDNSEITNSFEN